MKKTNEGSKSINVRVPASLHVLAKKICLDYGISITDLIVHYLKYLQKKTKSERQLLDAKSKATDFTFDA